MADSARINPTTHENRNILGWVVGGVVLLIILLVVFNSRTPRTMAPDDRGVNTVPPDQTR